MVLSVHTVGTSAGFPPSSVFGKEKEDGNDEGDSGIELHAPHVLSEYSEVERHSTGRHHARN